MGKVKVAKVTNNLKDEVGERVAGFFEPKTNTVHVDSEIGINPHTILHETTHALTSHVIANKSHPLTKQLIVDGRKKQILNKKINVRIPITLFHGLNDEVVPLAFSKKILKICNKSKKKLIKIRNGDHSLSRKSDLKRICKELSYMVSNQL